MKLAMLFLLGSTSLAMANECTFDDDFTMVFSNHDEYLSSNLNGHVTDYQLLQGNPGFWFAVEYDDHGMSATYLLVQNQTIFMTVHSTNQITDTGSIGKIIVSESFVGQCEEVVE